MASVNKKSIFILKELVSYRYKNSSLKQLQARRAWIEIEVRTVNINNEPCRSPHGERGLKFELSILGLFIGGCRSPHGERGLKLRLLRNHQH